MIVRPQIRPKVAAAIGFGLLTATCLFYQNYLFPSQVSMVGKGRVHALTKSDDPVLEMPFDPVPRRDFSLLSKFPPQNINEPSKFAFATLYCSRDPDTRGPYFESTQSIIWRLLWSDYHSKYPIIVFVCPFIPEENRRIFRGQGAIVKEIELIDAIIPDEKIPAKRWVDVLSKLNFWKEVEWNRIAFLDSDAFPVRNIDEIFDQVHEQHCNKTALSPEDAAVVNNGQGGEEMCNFVYAGVPQFFPDNINAGMLVLKPNLDMHAKLIRAAKKTADYDMKYMEQGVLGSKNAFASGGPFPFNQLSPVWNADPEYYKDYLAKDKGVTEGPIRVLHVKMWNRFWGAYNNLTHLNDVWDLDWMKMCRFYDSEDFVDARNSGKFETVAEKFFKGQLNQT